MGLFDFLKRRKTRSAKKFSDMSRIEFLLHLLHEDLEKPHKEYGDLTWVGLVEEKLSENITSWDAGDIGSHVQKYFELSNLYWGQGELERAQTYMLKASERHQRYHTLFSENDLDINHYRGMGNAKAAACLLGTEFEALPGYENDDIGYLPWFRETIIDYCLGTHDFDVASWQASEDKWLKNRAPKFILAEFDVYIKTLTGQYETTEDMFAAHEKMFKGRGKRKYANSDTIDGYFDNELIIDYIFACILKRIGWEGRYRHSWPNTNGYESIPETTREPDSYLKVIAAPEPEVIADTGIIADTQKARRYIDHHLKDQKFEGDQFYSAEREIKNRSKVSGVLKKMGWVKDPATLELMRAYRRDNVLNETTHIVLCDPVENSFSRLDNWTHSLSTEFGLHEDFIALAISEDRSDFMDPQGSWYVYWKKDKQVYAVDRDVWHDAEQATKDARLGLTAWPSYTSFVAWWVSEHLKSEFL